MMQRLTLAIVAGVLGSVSTGQGSLVLAQTMAPSEAQGQYAKAITAYRAEDYATAAPILISLCEQGYVQTCATAGRLAANGQGMEQDILKALNLFTIGCSGKAVESCRNAGAIHEQAAPPIRDQSKAAGFEFKACDLGDMRSCQKLGYRYVAGVGVEKDRETAFYLASKSCEGQDGEGCADVGRLYLPFSRSDPKGPQYDPIKAAEYYRKSCDLKSGRGCALLADKHETGVGVEKDPAKALELYKLALTYNPENWVQNSINGSIKRLEAAKAESTSQQ